MHKNWAMWLVLGGLAIDVIDAITSTGDAGGVFYGPTGMLVSVYNKFPGKLSPGETIAAVGAGFLAVHHFKG